MLFLTHLLFSLLLGTLSFKFFGLQPVLFVALVVLGGLLPDMDKANSKINNMLKITKPIAHMVRHRGIFHSIFLGALLAGLLAFYVNNVMGIALLIGYVGHLLIDGLNHAGVNLLHPIQKMHISGFIETGSLAEHIVTILIVVALLVSLKVVLF
jgi:inner membrane protein